MANLIVIVFDEQDEATRVRETLKSIENIGHLSLDDSAVVEKDEHGKIHVKNQSWSQARRRCSCWCAKPTRPWRWLRCANMTARCTTPRSTQKARSRFATRWKSTTRPSNRPFHPSYLNKEKASRNERLAFFV